jgi:hypothetical protein
MHFNVGDTTSHPILHGLLTMPQSTINLSHKGGASGFMVRHDGTVTQAVSLPLPPKTPKRIYSSKKQVHVTAEYNRSAVYLLFNKGEIVYVGQSVKPLQRIGQHQRDKTFDSYRILYCAENRRLYWESKLIDALNPPLNKTGKTFRGTR